MSLDKFRPVRLLPALCLLLLAGCNTQSVTAFHTAGAVGAHERNLMLITTVLMLFVFVPVVVLTLFFAWRYRESNSNATYAPKWSHSNLLEVFLWGGPIVIIGILGVLTWQSTHALDPYKTPEASGKTPIQVEAIALDWKWLFVYPKYDVAAVNELAMPVDTPISIHITADTVMNAIMIPRMGSQIFAMSGMRTQLHLLPTRKGRFFGKNYQYTGEGYADEAFHAVSISDDQFKKWVQKAKSSGERLDAKRYSRLMQPSHPTGVSYFSPVKPHLLNYVIQQYNDGTPRNHLTRTAER